MLRTSLAFQICCNLVNIVLCYSVLALLSSALAALSFGLSSFFGEITTALPPALLILSKASLEKALASIVKLLVSLPWDKILIPLLIGYVFVMIKGYPYFIDLDYYNGYQLMKERIINTLVVNWIWMFKK